MVQCHSIYDFIPRWDAFANEFFEDEAQLTLTFCLEDGPKRYSEWDGGDIDDDGDRDCDENDFFEDGDDYDENDDYEDGGVTT